MIAFNLYQELVLIHIFLLFEYKVSFYIFKIVSCDCILFGPHLFTLDLGQNYDFYNHFTCHLMILARNLSSRLRMLLN